MFWESVGKLPKFNPPLKVFQCNSNCFEFSIKLWQLSKNVSWECCDQFHHKFPLDFLKMKLMLPENLSAISYKSISCCCSTQNAMRSLFFSPAGDGHAEVLGGGGDRRWRDFRWLDGFITGLKKGFALLVGWWVMVFFRSREGELHRVMNWVVLFLLRLLLICLQVFASVVVFFDHICLN